MPDLERATTTATRAPSAAAATPSTDITPQAQFGNAFLQEQLQRSGSPGRLSWQGALGDTLGGKLYDALAAQLTDEKLLGHANRAVESALAALKGKLDGQGGTNDQEAAALLLAELDKALRQIAADAVVKSGLADGVRDVVDANPYAVALAAAAGAVAYVLSNQDLPLLESKLGLGGGHALVGGIDPGRTMALAIEQVRVGYRFDGDRVAAWLSGDRFQDGWGAEGGVRYTAGPDTQASLTGSHSDRDGVTRSRVDLTYVDPTVAANAWWQQDGSQTGRSQAVGASVSTRGDELQRTLSGTWRSDGSWETAAGVGQSSKDKSWSVEAFGGRDGQGREDYGVRALFRLRF